MALVDGIFSSIPGPLISQFGVDATYIKKSENETYNPNTGKVSNSSVEIPVKIILQSIRSKEKDGMQDCDVKVILSAVELGEHYPKISDSIKYLQHGRLKTIDIMFIDDYRGDFPIMHLLIGKISKSEAVPAATPPTPVTPRLVTINGLNLTTLDGAYITPI